MLIGVAVAGSLIEKIALIVYTTTGLFGFRIFHPQQPTVEYYIQVCVLQLFRSHWIIWIYFAIENGDGALPYYFSQNRLLHIYLITM